MAKSKRPPRRAGLFYVIKYAIWPEKAHRLEIDSTAFNADPIAQMTDWTVIMSGGANFTTDYLVREGADKLTFKPTRARRFSGLLLAIIGLVFLIGAIVAMLNSPSPMWTEAIYATAIAWAFFWAARFILLQLERRVVFDFGKGKLTITSSQKRSLWLALEDYEVPFSSIHALQLLPDLLPTETTIDLGFELNAVFTDGTRGFIIGHGGEDRIKADAQMLAAALDKPLWDASLHMKEIPAS